MITASRDSAARILLVGDDADGLEALAQQLADHNIVGMATSHARALKLLEGRRPQVVLVDSSVPDTREATEFARNLQQRGDAACLLLLPAGEPVDGLLAQYLHKPLGEGELRLAIRMVMACKLNDAEIDRQRQMLAVAQQELAAAYAKLDTLGGLLSLCSYCHSIRNEAGEWEALHHYLSRRAGTAFSHGVCAHCRDEAGEGSLP